MSRRTFTALAGAAFVVLIASASAFLLVGHVLQPTTITATFTSANAIYAGDEVRIAGVEVGTVTAIRPVGTHAELTLEVDSGVHIPLDAKAVIVAPNLVAARFVQLTPAYSGGPQIPDGADIPVERTAVPVEWDEVKEQLTRLATDLGPHGDVDSSSIGRFIDSTANAMDGNGEKLRHTLAELAGISRVFAEGSGDIALMIENLDTFVAVLRDSNAQIVQFQDRLASLSSVLDGSRSDLDAALTNLSSAVADVRRFVSANRGRTTEQLQRLTAVTQNLVDHRGDLEQVLHVAPSALANAYNMMDPRTGGASGVFVLNNMANPTMFFCGMISALENVTAPETGELCARYLGPGLDRVNFNYLPFPVNPLLTAIPSPEKLIYTDPKLRPGGPGTTSGFMPIAQEDSAYTNPAYASTPATVPDLLMPAERATP